MRATSEVENSISIIATFPSSLEKILEKGSVWYMRKPLDVPEFIRLGSVYLGGHLTDCQTAVILVECHEIHLRDGNLFAPRGGSWRPGAVVCRQKTGQPAAGSVASTRSFSGLAEVCLLWEAAGARKVHLASVCRALIAGSQ